MQVVTSKALINSTYRIEIALEEDGLTRLEDEAIVAFGEPTVACGGTFEYGDDDSFDLPDNDKSFPSDFPVSESFSLVDYPEDADLRADAWKTAIITRLTDAMKDLRSTPSGETGREVLNINTTPT
jgi:hypothetical protein